MSVGQFDRTTGIDAARTESSVVDTNTHERILRPVWCDLIRRIEPRWIINKLYQLHVVGYQEMDQIKSCATRKERAEALMDAIVRKSQRGIIAFATLLCETDDLSDLGKKIRGHLHLDGPELPADHRLVQENAELKDQLRRTSERYRDACHEIQRLKAQLHERETRQTATPEKEQGLMSECSVTASLKEQGLFITSSQLPDVPNIGRTTNCATALDNGTMFMSYWAGSRLNVLGPGSTDWSVQVDLKQPIWNVFSSQNTCYIRASWSNTIFRLADSQWSKVADFPSRLVCSVSGGYASLLANDQFIYRLGGYKGAPLSTATRYDMKSQKWETLPEMPFTSYWCSSALIDDVLYVGGGYHEKRPLTSMAALSLNESKWRMLPSLEHGSATISKFASHLVATGGYTSLCGTQEAVDTVSLFEPKAGRWMPLSSMAGKHVGHGACLTPNDGLAVMGGSGSQNVEILRLS